MKKDNKSNILIQRVVSVGLTPIERIKLRRLGEYFISSHSMAGTIRRIIKFTYHTIGDQEITGEDVDRELEQEKREYRRQEKVQRRVEGEEIGERKREKKLIDLYNPPKLLKNRKGRRVRLWPITEGMLEEMELQEDTGEGTGKRKGRPKGRKDRKRRKRREVKGEGDSKLDESTNITNGNGIPTGESNQPS